MIIVDDGSTDDTVEVVRSFSDKCIIYIKTENWGGLLNHVIFGIENARGEYIAFCDDDVWVKEKLELQLKVFN